MTRGPWQVIMDGHPQLSEEVEVVEAAEEDNPSRHLGEEAEHQEAAFLVAKTLTLSRYEVTNVTA
jgi:hypothetical protein